MFVFPGDPPTAQTNYLAVVGPGTAWTANRVMSLDEFQDGSNTILIVENKGSGILWSEPRDLELETMNLNLQDNPSNGISTKFRDPGVVMVDGTIHEISKDVPPSTVRAMLTADRADNVPDGRVVELPNGRDLTQIETATELPSP